MAKLGRHATTGWRRSGWNYNYTTTWLDGETRHEVTRTYGFITYHLIRLIHGEKELDRLGNAYRDYEQMLEES